MRELTVIFERHIKGRVHRTVLTRTCYLHCDVVGILFERANRYCPELSIESLFDQIVGTH